MAKTSSAECFEASHHVALLARLVGVGSACAHKALAQNGVVNRLSSMARALSPLRLPFVLGARLVALGKRKMVAHAPLLLSPSFAKRVSQCIADSAKGQHPEW